ncbi:restriction endonuclease-like protein [Bacillus sp. ISL-46]|uniref:restriction endonuclease-like protein n=1 Tax=Bacillus sp. ISL-46 TaxID=2819129 RepID=UPI001BE6AAAB|nr:restriction endonuclease-like protein [Bacillus sp. ISL-46]MBT2720222.1 restriction endonuclease-like protein [Bacillus sp. ISL-46]
MASLPSGSREDVELVQIETDDLSLIIKGKPYHERYEGLKQYRNMDYHDVMKFSVHGEGIQEIKVYDINQQQLVQPMELRPIFFENGIYQLIVMPKTGQELTFYHEHPLLRKSISALKIGQQSMLMGNLQFQNEVGFTTFEIRNNSQKILEVTLEIYPSKLDYKNDYKKLVEEVNDEIYNLAYHFIRKTYLGARLKLEGKPSRSEFYRLISLHFQKFLQAVSRIEQQPHHKLEKTYEKARGDQLRKLDSTSRNYLRKRSNLFVEVENGISFKKKNLMPLEGLRIKKELTYDTVENRYVKWMIGRLIHKLNDLLESILNLNKRTLEDPDPDLVERIKKMTHQLQARVKNSFWSNIGSLDRSVMSLVLQMAPGYRDAFQIYLTVSKGLVLEGKIYQMSVKDVATLYEYWTFLKLGQILGRKYKLVSQDIVQVNREGLFVNLEANRIAKRVFKHPITNEEIVLTYQKYEGGLPTLPQKPDTMLSIRKKGKDYTFNYIFDAKYRIDYAQADSYYQKRYKTPGPMEDDINTMHRYRDSIVASEVDGPYERTAFGAYVLFPWFDEQSYQEHHFYQSINKVNIGGLPFLPNVTTLVEQFVERLIDTGPEEIQKEGILPRGTLAEWKSSLDETVLVGLVSNKEDYDLFIKEGYYSIPVEKLKRGWQHAKYVALYVKSGVNAENGVLVYGKIQEVQPARASEIELIRFKVAYWMNLNPIIKPVHYGISKYVLTTLSVLKEATELPELFMKSKEEMIIWRILRRVSDRIKLDLDDSELDHASSVMEYRIKGMKVIMHKSERNIVFVKNDVKKEVPFEDLEKNPTGVFKVLMGIMSDGMS